MSAQHTPLPWSVAPGNGDLDQRAKFPSYANTLVMAPGDCDTHPVADCSCNHTCRTLDEQEASAAFIVKACNSHDELLRLVSEMLELADNWPGIAYTKDLNSRATAAIAKATGGTA